VTYSDVEGGANGTGNIDADPLFANPGNGQYQLQTSPSPSPCINAGSPDGAPSVDIDGHARTGAPDIGCYEAQ
jgi:hypothetical protein